MNFFFTNSKEVATIPTSSPPSKNTIPKLLSLVPLIPPLL
jgi:hypothetical protein